jgi:hypothetical protein
LTVKHSLSKQSKIVETKLFLLVDMKLYWYIHWQQKIDGFYIKLQNNIGMEILNMALKRMKIHGNFASLVSQSHCTKYLHLNAFSSSKMASLLVADMFKLNQISSCSSAVESFVFRNYITV